MNNYESILSKARKLAAIIDPASNATDGERANAQRMLQEHCQRHGITLEALCQSARRSFTLPLLARRHVVTLKDDLHKLAYNCLCFVTDRTDHDFELHYSHPALAVKRGKRVVYQRPPETHYIMTVELTELEYEDWVACYYHYADDFIDSRIKLQEAAKIAAKAARMYARGFLNKHNIFAASGEASKKKLTPAQRAALIAAMRGSQGEAWTKPAGKLQPEFLLQ